MFVKHFQLQIYPRIPILGSEWQHSLSLSPKIEWWYLFDISTLKCLKIRQKIKKSKASLIILTTTTQENKVVNQNGQHNQPWYIHTEVVSQYQDWEIWRKKCSQNWKMNSSNILKWPNLKSIEFLLKLLVILQKVGSLKIVSFSF